MGLPTALISGVVHLQRDLSSLHVDGYVLLSASLRIFFSLKRTCDQKLSSESMCGRHHSLDFALSVSLRRRG